MASDAVIAGVSGLLGVFLSGGTQTLLAVRSDRRNRRAATRLVRGEARAALVGVEHLVRAIQEGGEIPDYAKDLEPPVVFLERRDSLARELPEAAWFRVSEGFAHYESVRSVTTHMLKYAPEITERIADAASPKLEAAELALAPWRHRREIRQHAKKLRSRRRPPVVPTRSET
jgi:hypothetical protein